MTWHCSLPRPVGQIDPTRMFGSFLEQSTTISPKVLDQGDPFHKRTISWTTLVFACGKRPKSTGSSMSEMASLRFLRAASSVRPCVIAPGTSSVQPIHHFPRCRKFARYSAMASTSSTTHKELNSGKLCTMFSAVSIPMTLAATRSNPPAIDSVTAALRSAKDCPNPACGVFR